MRLSEGCTLAPGTEKELPRGSESCRGAALASPAPDSAELSKE